MLKKIKEKEIVLSAEELNPEEINKIKKPYLEKRKSILHTCPSCHRQYIEYADAGVCSASGYLCAYDMCQMSRIFPVNIT